MTAKHPKKKTPYNLPLKAIHREKETTKKRGVGDAMTCGCSLQLSQALFLDPSLHPAEVHP